MTLLQVESVSVSFVRGATRVQVLRDVSLALSAGELLAIYGRRAAGKTTLLEVAAGLIAPRAGRIVFDGVDLGTLSRRALARVHREDIGWVDREGPQATDMPAGVHVAVPLYRSLGRREAEGRAGTMLDRVGAGDLASACWHELPDTGRVRVAIAQALVREPKALIVDDPTYGLGPDERDAIIGLLSEIAEQARVGVLLAVPDMSAMRGAHQVRVLAGGRLVAPADRGEGGRILAFPGARREA